jgi:predicted short-subunit dehydrogenase-like oxidoreductase (DUF2520 family)
MPQTLNLIGAGRVGQTLARLWHERGVFTVQDVLTGSLGTAQNACKAMGAGRAVDSLAAMHDADVWMLAVPDAQISAVAIDLAGSFQATNESAQVASTGASRNVAKVLAPLVFHCSGAQGAALLEPLRALGWHSASAHCILSFASVDAAMAQFPGTPCALEGDAIAIAALHGAFTAIEARCFEVQSANKLLYHAAAVFATNFLPVLQSVAEDAWTASGVPAELLPGLRSALLHNAVANITRLGPKGALTGPAARGDVEAITRQASAVREWDAQAGAAYEALSGLALRLAKSTTDTSATPATRR